MRCILHSRTGNGLNPAGRIIRISQADLDGDHAGSPGAVPSLFCFSSGFFACSSVLLYVHSLLDVGSVNEGQVYRLGHIRRGEHQDVVSLSKIVDLSKTEDGPGATREQRTG